MKVTILLALIISLSISLIGKEIDSEIITVQTGWTQEKAELSEYWTNLPVTQRQTELANLEQTLVELLPMLPENEYSYEENKLVGYRMRLENSFRRLSEELSPWSYAEFSSLLKEAEHYVWYIEREKKLPHSSTEEAETGDLEQINKEGDYPRQGMGWLFEYIDLSLSLHATPSIASLGDTIFVACSNVDDADSVFLWQSVDGGNTWSLWHIYGSESADRIVCDLAIDPENHYLYYAYCYHSATVDRAIWIRRFTDFNDPSATNIYGIETGSDVCDVPHLSVEHQYSEHRLCCIYHNETTDNMVIKQSDDYGQTWSPVYTSSWTVGTYYPKPKGAQGASGSTTDKFYFVAQKEDNSLVVLESTSGLSGTWTETEYTHAQDIDAVDISASHNHIDASAVVAFGYVWSPTDYNIRILFRPEGGPGFVSQLIDSDGKMTKTPVITCDGEWAPNNAGPDYYHLSYYKDHDDDDYYIPFALRCLNDSTSLDAMENTNPDNFEVVGANVIDTLTTSVDYGYPAGWYQIDMTTIWNAYHSQWFPTIAWIHYYSGTDRDPRLSVPDYEFGIEESESHDVLRFVSLAPNPSNGSAKLSYVVKQEGNVKILLYDAAGRLVNTVVHEIKNAGDYSFTLDNKALAAGVYFIRVETPDGVATKTMTIVR
jgi:hypothetical protein